MNTMPQPEYGQTAMPGARTGSGFAAVPPRPAIPPQPLTPPALAVGQQPGYPSAGPEMPQQVKTARIVLFLLAGLQVVLGLAALAQAAAARSALAAHHGAWFEEALSSEERVAEAWVQATQVGLVWAVVYAALAVTLAARSGRGGKALRIGAITFGAWLSVTGAFGAALATGSAPTAAVASAVLQLAAGVTLIILMVNKDCVAWFNRPRH